MPKRLHRRRLGPSPSALFRSTAILRQSCARSPWRLTSYRCRWSRGPRAVLSVTGRALAHHRQRPHNTLTPPSQCGVWMAWLRAGLSQEALAARARLSVRGIIGLKHSRRPATVTVLAEALELGPRSAPPSPPGISRCAAGCHEGRWLRRAENEG